MTSDQIIILTILAVTVGMFLWGRWRHDIIAMGALLACAFTGLVSSGEAFSGFGHPAVITVACVLVLGHGLQISGAMDVVARYLLPASASLTLSILSLISLGAVLSAFMNNVGALALLMPIAIQMAAKHDLPAGKILMPLAFGSILGGMTTLIGTPPNLIVSGFRETTGAGTFSMFDFSPVGASVALFGVLFVGLIGWRITPTRKHAETASFNTGTYLSEVRIEAGSKAEKMKLLEVEHLLDEADAQIVGLIRNELRIATPNRRWKLRADDILIIEIEPESLPNILTSLGLKLEEDVPPEKSVLETKKDTTVNQTELSDDNKEERSDEIVIQELVVMPGAILSNRSASNIELRSRYGINLLAISRQGRRSIKRLRSTPLHPGDVLLMQGTPEALAGFAALFNCLPLATRDIRVPIKGHALIATLVMTLTVTAAAFGLVPTAIAFATGAGAFAVIGIVPLRSIYTSVDWPVVVLLAAMLPVAAAMSSTGTADMIARFLLDTIAQGQATTALVVILVVTMFLSDLMNNTATAAVMCPISLSTALQLGVHPDAFLMAVAVGASCSFLTPIGHQNNTLILGPGGFRFGDYWRLGLMVEAIVVLVSVPMLLWVWPL